MKYEWDEQKRQSNLLKHGFDFADAKEIFIAPILARLDTRFDYGEDRWVAIGFLKQRIIVVVYTEDNERQVRRIISLRKALTHERKRFEAFLSN